MQDRGLEGRAVRNIHIGGIHASGNGDVVRTILGSCIAVCLRDPVRGIGGMNHFMLPDTKSERSASARYGVHAMELLINKCMGLGADRSHLEAKVFGGGHVLQFAGHANDVPSRNIRFALEFLQLEGISVAKKDVGGLAGREVYFFTDSGRVLMRRMQRTGMTREMEQALKDEEQNVVRTARVRPVAPETDDNVTLF